ncbi:hypothetical protein CEXT_420051 [Caerostris extrusa]|uniref:Uncharacterized protein n=1 Tax=Caerostris extrusa TaxID=172846 RepID=A0AAV4XH43_CAEEX|nr:hypothetical protein CEXT_420051 [Caerostris extrusa]
MHLGSCLKGLFAKNIDCGPFKAVSDAKHQGNFVHMALQQNRLLNKQDPGMTEYRLLRIRSIMNNEHVTHSNVDEGGEEDCSPRDRLPRTIDWGRMTQTDH